MSDEKKEFKKRDDYKVLEGTAFVQSFGDRGRSYGRLNLNAIISEVDVDCMEYDIDMKFSMRDNHPEVLQYTIVKNKKEVL